MTVKFKSSAKDMNHIVQKAIYMVLFKKYKPKISRDTETTSSDKKSYVYGINFLNLGKSSNDSDSYFDLLFVHLRYGLMTHKRNIMLHHNNECNVL